MWFQLFQDSFSGLLEASGNFALSGLAMILSAGAYYGGAYYGLVLNNFGVFGTALSYNAQRAANLLLIIVFAFYKNPIPGAFNMPKSINTESLVNLAKFKISFGAVGFLEGAGFELTSVISGKLAKE